MTNKEKAFNVLAHMESMAKRFWQDDEAMEAMNNFLDDHIAEINAFCDMLHSQFTIKAKGITLVIDTRLRVAIYFDGVKEGVLYPTSDLMELLDELY